MLPCISFQKQDLSSALITELPPPGGTLIFLLFRTGLNCKSKVKHSAKRTKTRLKTSSRALRPMPQRQTTLRLKQSRKLREGSPLLESGPISFSMALIPRRTPDLVWDQPQMAEVPKQHNTEPAWRPKSQCIGCPPKAATTTASCISWSGPDRRCPPTSALHTAPQSESTKSTRKPQHRRSVFHIKCSIYNILQQRLGSHISKTKRV